MWFPSCIFIAIIWITMGVLGIIAYGFDGSIYSDIIVIPSAAIIMLGLAVLGISIIIKLSRRKHG